MRYPEFPIVLRLIVLTCFVGITAKLPATASIDPALSTPPNVVLILVDDYGYADISNEGNTQIQTPNIDRIAHEGTQFTRFYQSAGACAPTRAALLTGRHFYETGVWGVHWGRDFIHSDEHTLGDLLQGAGYRTGVFGKWHSGKTEGFFGWNRGFDTSVHTTLYDYWDTNVLADRKLLHVAGPITNVVGDRAVAFIEENQHQPFFCYIPFQAVHEPFNCPEAIFNRYKDLGYSDHVARLYGMIEVLDDNVGKVLATLERLGLDEDTLVLFLVDDGSSPGFDLTYQTRRMNDEEKAQRKRGWGRELSGTKANIGEGGQITPFYARWPGKIPAGRTVDHLSGVLDLYPTLAELCGATYPETQLPLRGISIAPALLGGSIDTDERIYFDGTNLYLIERSRAFVNDIPRIRELSAHYRHYKYIREDRFLIDGKDEVRHLLFDLEADPMESTNIASSHPEVLGLLKTETEAWFQSMLDTGRAFEEVTFPVGLAADAATPIHLDSTVEIKGSLKRDNGPGFQFTGWSQPGNALVFQIDVQEAGTYAVELNYRLAGNPTGAVFEIRTPHASTTCTIDHSTAATSPLIHLPEGPQRLEIILTELPNGGDAVEWLERLVVRKLEETDPGTSFEEAAFQVHKLSTNQDDRIALEPRYPALDFMKGTDNPVLELQRGELLALSVTTELRNAMHSAEVFLGFDRIASLDMSEESVVIRPNTPGRHTLMVEWLDSEGRLHHHATDLQVN